MTGPNADCFALLGLTRQPWLDPVALKQRYLTLSSQCHPDARGAGAGSVATEAVSERERGESFAALNNAHQTLRETRTRLAHLLELETGAVPERIQAVDQSLADLFFQVGALCRQVDAFLADRSKATSPLGKAGLFARGLEWTGRLQDLLQKIGQTQTSFETELHSMNGHWLTPAPRSERDHPRQLARLEEIYRHVSYLNRWTAQLQERLVQLAV